MSHTGRTTRLAGVLIGLLVLSAVAAPPATAAEQDDERFRVDLDAAGDANVSVTYAYDLETDAERTAFDDLATNETARTRLATRFERRMAAVAADASTETGRSMAVGDATLAVESADGVGTVTLTVHWEQLAATDGDRLVVTEPFASGFQPDRTFTVRAPAGYEVASASPTPSSGGEAMVTWEAGTDLSGFELVGAPSETAGDESPGAGAGFGVVVAVVALVGVALAARR